MSNIRHDRLSIKLQTIPFQQSPSRATHILENAAASAFGLSSFNYLVASRIMNKLGYSLKPKFEMIGFKLLLLPVWKLDLALRSRITMDEGREVDLFVSTDDASLPGFNLSPLDELTLNPAMLEEELTTYSPSIHNRQHDLDVTVFPFTRSPMKLFEMINNLPRTTVENNGIMVDPRRISQVLFAAYPLLLPIYLAEFVEVAGEKRRLTAVNFATSKRPAFSLYPSFLETPEWMPQGDTVSLDVAGISANDEEGPLRAKTLQIIQPKLAELISKARAPQLTTEITSLSDVEDNPLVMNFADHAIGNQDYIKANRDLLAAQGRLRTVNLIPEDVSAIIVSKKGFVVASGKAAVREAKRETERLEKTVRIMKPKWMEVMEKNPIVIKAPVAVEAPVVLMEKAKQVKSGKKNSANGKKSNR